MTKQLTSCVHLTDGSFRGTRRLTKPAMTILGVLLASLAVVPEAAAQWVQYDSGHIECNGAVRRVQIYQPQPWGLPGYFPARNVSPFSQYQERVYWQAKLESSSDLRTWVPAKLSAASPQLQTGWIYATTRKSTNLVVDAGGWAFWFHYENGYYVDTTRDNFGKFIFVPGRRYYRFRQSYWWPASNGFLERYSDVCWMQ